MRNRYNLSHLSHVVGHIGRLQTICVIPVIAGDSLQIDMTGIFRLAPTRKEIVSECQLDICAFYAPHRHAYGNDAWKDVIGSGLQSVTTLPAGPAVDANSRDPFYLGIHTCGANINQSLNYNYNAILNRYFMVPTTTGNGTMGGLNYNFYPNGTTSELVNTRRFGPRIARLPHILNGPIQVNQGTSAGGFIRNYTQSDWGVQIPQDTPVVGTALLDIRDLKQIQSRYESIQEQNYFAAFYSDLLARKWDTKGVNTDADQRPTYLGRNTTFVSGTDVNGTDDATLGSYVGKTVAPIRFNLPRRFFAEHGNVYLMMVPRYPLVHTREQHPLLATAQNNQQLLIADPKVWEGQPVVAFDPNKWLAGGAGWAPNVNTMQEPYGQEYRYQPNRVHPVFDIIPGYPFSDWSATNVNEWYYYTDNEYTETFQTSQIAHWQAHMSLGITKFSTILDPKTSIFAGA